MRHKLGGLPHIEVSDGISEAALKTDNRLEKDGRTPSSATSLAQMLRAPNIRAYHSTAL